MTVRGMLLWAVWLALSVVAPTFAASGERDEPRILETFEVGPQVYVRSLAVDPVRHSLWIGTSLGVHEIDLASRDLRRTFTRQQGLANEYVFATFVDSKDNKWFGTNGGGVSRFRDGDWKTYFPMHGLADYWVYSFAEQSDGTIWIGTWAGANRLDPGKEVWKTYYDELVNEWVYGIAVDAKDRVWFGTEGGVSMFDGKQWQAWTHQHGLGAPNLQHLKESRNTGLGTRDRHNLSVLIDGEPTYNPGYVFCVHADPEGQIWVGTWGGGVSRFDGKAWHNLTSADGLAGDIVFAVAQDENGVFWFGTNKGLSRYDGHTWHNYTSKEGLPGDAVYAVAVVPGGDVWVGTMGGVARIGVPVKTAGK